jgi:signal transduction histidine kinase
MKSTAIKLLIVDDDDGDRMQIIRSLKRSGLTCEWTEAATLDEALVAIGSQHFDCVILDYYLPGATGFDGISMLLSRDPMLPIILSTGHGNEQIASKAIKLGALDYINKAEFDGALLRGSIEQVIHRAGINRALDEQQRALAVFARVLVHDMKSPTQSILGFARLIEVFMKQETLEREKIIGQAKRIAEGALRMNALLDKLHAYTQSEAQPQFENLDLQSIIADVLANLDVTIQQTGARISCEDHLPAICADRAQLIQLLQNLIGNGIKYCRAEVPEISIGVTPSQDQCVIEVRDNGIGIAEKDYKDIFEAFRRLHGHGEYEGTGLGLATCKKIVERHGGTIWCKSKLGEGTSFFFTMPMTESNSAGNMRSMAGASQIAHSGSSR